MSSRPRRRREPIAGIIYLLHFSEPYVAQAWPGAPSGVPCPDGWHPKQRVQHYLGFTEDLDERLRAHQCGEGAQLARVAIDAGLSFELARTWRGDRALEKRLKATSPARLCPHCHGERALRRGHFIGRRGPSGRVAAQFAN